MIANLAHELAANFWGTIAWLFVIVFVAFNVLFIAVLVTAAFHDWQDRHRPGVYVTRKTLRRIADDDRRFNEPGTAEAEADLDLIGYVDGGGKRRDREARG